MKSLYESIIGNANIGSAYYKKYIKEQPIGKYSDITFSDFLNNVDDDTMVRCLKLAFADGNKKMSKGVAQFYFKDGALGVEIMLMDFNIFNKQKWWRQAFVQNEDIEKVGINKPITTYYYLKQYSANNNLQTFTTDFGERLNKIVRRYIDFLKANKDVLIRNSNV